MYHFRLPVIVLVLLTSAGSFSPGLQAAGVDFTIRSTRSGEWSNPATWTPNRVPKGGDLVQIRPGHRVLYDVSSEQAIRMIHVSGTLTFARDRTTRLDVGLIKVQPGEEATEDGFLCDYCPVDPKMPMPALEIGSGEQPIPTGVTASIRLVYFDGTDRESLPGILVCRARWDVHGAPMNRTWVKLGATVRKGASEVTLAEPVTGWRIGDRVLLTASNNVQKLHGNRASLRNDTAGRLETEERRIAGINGSRLVLDAPLNYDHVGEGTQRSEVANLSRNVVIESANPAGVRGHTMYHRNAAGGISYAEFRHLGKEGILGRYALHFHLVGESMRGSSLVGASIWDSHNRWVTIHGTDYLLVRDCVGYRSVGHGFFLEDGTEQYNVLDRNLAVQAFEGKPLPKQVLPFDLNEGAGFWWANARNTFTRNVSLENDRYGFFFEMAKTDGFNPVQRLRMPDGKVTEQDVRAIPFLRFEDNEVHSQRFYGFKFGDHKTEVGGDRTHPFIARNLTAWQTHYLIRPNLHHFLLDGFHGTAGTYAIYQADYDHHVYRNIRLTRISNRGFGFAGRADGHGRGGIQEGPYTAENITFDHVQTKSHPLICMSATSQRPGEATHLRNVKVVGPFSRHSLVDVQLSGDGLDGANKHGPTFYFHDHPAPGEVLKVVSTVHPNQLEGGTFTEVPGVTGSLVRAAKVKAAFPTLLEPVDDLPPASLITAIRQGAGRVHVQGTTQDNGEIASVTVQGVAVTVRSRHPGVVNWEVELPLPKEGSLSAEATDRAGNTEKTKHVVKVR